MSGDVETYRQQLLLALRLREVPGPRIAEVLAEVETHLADSGEDPQEAFGPARAYAAQVAVGSGRPARAWLTWRDAGLAVASLGGAWLLSDAVFALAAGTPATGGLPALLGLLAGLALLAAVGASLSRALRSTDDRVLDPRTGADMAPPVPRWATAVGVAVPAAALLAAVVLGLASR